MILTDKQIEDVKAGRDVDRFSFKDMTDTIDDLHNRIAKRDVDLLQKDVVHRREMALLNEIINGAASLAAVTAGLGTADVVDAYVADGILMQIRRNHLMKIAEFLEANEHEAAAKLLREEADTFYPRPEEAPPTNLVWSP